MTADDATVEVPGLDGTTRERVYDHVFRRTDREVGGVLVGRAGRRGGPPLVTGAIEAVEATEHLTTLTFTQASWEHVHRVMERRYPDDQIVGWYHSHPGHGIFLSEQDLFIHRNFFGGPSQIAWVIDPVAGDEGVFGWQDGEIVQWHRRATSWPAVPRVSRASPLPAPRVRTSVPAPAGSPPPGRRAKEGGEADAALVLIGLLLAGVLAGFGLWEGVLRGHPQARSAPSAVTVVQRVPAARSAARRAARPVEHTTTTLHKAKSGLVPTYTVEDPNVGVPPLPDPGGKP
jgi:proteasome lid subunit RPN8/RPN11